MGNCKESNPEEIINQAEDLLHVAREETRPLDLNLKENTIQKIIGGIQVGMEVERILLEAFRDGVDTEGRIHEESMPAVMIQKLRNLLLDEDEESVDQSPEIDLPRKVRVTLSAEELDFINEELVDYIVSGPHGGATRVSSVDPELGKWVGDLQLNSFQEYLPAFLDFNQAIERAGGTPHPEFLRYREI